MMIPTSPKCIPVHVLPDRFAEFMTTEPTRRVRRVPFLRLDFGNRSMVWSTTCLFQSPFIVYQATLLSSQLQSKHFAAVGTLTHCALRVQTNLFKRCCTTWKTLCVNPDCSSLAKKRANPDPKPHENHALTLLGGLAQMDCGQTKTELHTGLLYPQELLSIPEM